MHVLAFPFPLSVCWNSYTITCMVSLADTSWRWCIMTVCENECLSLIKQKNTNKNKRMYKGKALSNAFSFENAYFSMCFHPSSTLQWSKTLIVFIKNGIVWTSQTSWAHLFVTCADDCCSISSVFERFSVNGENTAKTIVWTRSVSKTHQAPSTCIRLSLKTHTFQCVFIYHPHGRHDNNRKRWAFSS